MGLKPTRNFLSSFHFWPYDKLGPHPLFLWFQPKWKAIEEVWFTTIILIDWNQL